MVRAVLQVGQTGKIKKQKGQGLGQHPRAAGGLRGHSRKRKLPSRDRL